MCSNASPFWAGPHASPVGLKVQAPAADSWVRTPDPCTHRHPAGAAGGCTAGKRRSRRNERSGTMKPGQVVEISPSAHADLPPVKGQVVEASHHAIVIDLDPARRGSFAPHTPLALSYDGKNGREELATRVIGMQGPNKLIVLPAGE